jgi:hypothetical protein
MRPCYHVDLVLNDELFIHSDTEIQDYKSIYDTSINREERKDAESKLREVEKELYQIVRSVKSKLNTIDLGKYGGEVNTRSSFNNFNSIYLLMVPK